ncbi:ATP-binding protein [Phormidium sp. LEGE 05292]|uniref:ATP-binding protein n=1 Tax=[Phormidium] sp. LEGE 05292 TaxID=767427 RepID=UPI00187FBA1C|nr:ATP-binding protein [Phormidium sp. LEGE 05292]MBE9224582.1 ATP-binding protein [Phormidium sp. LEGE 05292]
MEQITVPGTLDSLSEISKYVLSAASAARLDKKATYRLRLAVDEIATNVIIYGYEDAKIQGNLDLQAKIDDSSLTILMEDNAGAFDPTTKFMLEEESINLPMEQRAIGGLGVYLAIQGVDRFMYERSGDRNRNIFVVHLH